MSLFDNNKYEFGGWSLKVEVWLKFVGNEGCRLKFVGNVG